jgi:hypothetical protein
MAFDLGQMTDLIGITVTAGVVTKIADDMFPPRDQPVKRTRKTTHKNKSKEPQYHQTLYNSLYGR